MSVILFNLLINLTSCQIIREVENGDLAALLSLQQRSAWDFDQNLCERFYEALFKLLRVNTVDNDQCLEARSKLFVTMTYTIIHLTSVSARCTGEGPTLVRFYRRLVEESETVLYWAI